MGLPQFYIPGAKSLVDVDATALGFGVTERLPDAIHRGGMCHGPDQGMGFIIALKVDGQPDPKVKVGYFPDRQTWHECDGGKYWIGIDNDNPPTPEDLQRPTSVLGYPTELADGNKWHIPVARSFPSGTTLPESLDLGPDGEVVSTVMPQFVALSLVAEGLYLEFMATQTFEAEWDVLVDLAVDALCVNYFGGKWLFAKALRLFTKSNITQTAFALIDGPLIQEYLLELQDTEKKRASDSSEPLDGQPLTESEPGTNADTQDSATCGSMSESTTE